MYPFFYRGVTHRTGMIAASLDIHACIYKDKEQIEINKIVHFESSNTNRHLYIYR